MNRLDVYYRALRQYRSVTAVRHCAELRAAIAKADRDKDALTVTETICTVDEDWIDAIEKGLGFIEKAIGEERQFIYSNGEVLPIEKVKRVSKESVEHLSRHSNLITKEKRGEHMIPDRLYSVEKLNDYAVYENRFLYTLLCYLRDFITVRYEKILALSLRYDGALRLNKTVVSHGRRLTYSVDLHDERTDDPILSERNPAKKAVDRMDLALKSVIALLSTPLMETAGKAPRLKPPITKTNVLKMDDHFKHAMELYEYVLAYDRPGYTVERRERNLAPFTDALADELAESCGMLAFLTYEHGLGLNDTLKRRFEEAERREKDEKLERRARRLEQWKRKWESGEASPAETVAELESAVRLLQGESRELRAVRSRLTETERREAQLREQLRAMTEENRRLRDRLAETERLREREQAQIHEAYGERLEKNAREIKEQYGAALLEAEESHTAERGRLEQALLESDALRESETRALRDALTEKESALASISADRDRLSALNLVCEARIKALRSQNGEHFDENAFTEQEDFNELERELQAFVRFYDERWGIAKRAIRRKLLRYGALTQKQKKD